MGIGLALAVLAIILLVVFVLLFLARKFGFFGAAGTEAALARLLPR